MIAPNRCDDEENRRHRSDADQLPVLDETTCMDDGRAIDDPITASARILWMMRERRPVEEAVGYFTEHVLGQI